MPWPAPLPNAMLALISSLFRSVAARLLIACRPRTSPTNGGNSASALATAQYCFAFRLPSFGEDPLLSMWVGAPYAARSAIYVSTAGESENIVRSSIPFVIAVGATGKQHLAPSRSGRGSGEWVCALAGVAKVGGHRRSRGTVAGAGG